LAPELEAWLCQDASAIARFLGVSEKSLFSSTDPKATIERAFYSRHRRSPRPNDYERIARLADMTLWLRDPAFFRLAAALRDWFGIEFRGQAT
jgi:hypothetical protein